MSDLEPLFDTSDDARTRALLGAGRTDSAPPDFAQQLLLGLSVTAVAATAASTASATVQGVATSGSATMPSLALVVTKWLAVGVVGGALLAGGAELAFSPSPAKRARAASSSEATLAPATVEPRPAPSAASVTPTTGSISTLSSAVGPRKTRESNEAARATPRTTPLVREVQAIDRVRRALALGHAARALAELDVYDSLTSTHVLDREARVLRIQALYLQGGDAQARKLVDSYVQELPNDAHAARLRALRDAH